VRTSLFPTNVHLVERLVRVLGGIVLVSFVFIGPKTPVGWIGGLLVLTGMVGSCPLYSLLGVTTCRTKAT